MSVSIKDVKKGSAGGTALTLSNFSVNPAVGDVIVVGYALFSGTVADLPTDSQGNTYVALGTLSAGSQTKVAMFASTVTTAGATAVTSHGTYSHIAMVAWLLTGMSSSAYNSDYLNTQASGVSANVGPTALPKYPGSIYIGMASVSNTNNLGDPSGYNTEGVNGFNATMHTAASMLDWATHEDLQTAYIIPAASGVQTTTWPNTTSGNQWAAELASFSPPRVALPTSVAPTEVATLGGDQLVITGTAGSFGSWVTGVTVGGVAATSVVVQNDTTITCTSPAHAAGAVNIVVTGSEGNSSNLAGLTYSIRPVISGITPQFVFKPGGTLVTITGSGFVTGATVSFGGVPATGVTVVNANTITCTAPDGPVGSITITVTNP